METLSQRGLRTSRTQTTNAVDSEITRSCCSISVRIGSVGDWVEIAGVGDWLVCENS